MKKLILLIGLLGLLISSYGQLQVPAVASSVQAAGGGYTYLSTYYEDTIRSRWANPPTAETDYDKYFDTLFYKLDTITDGGTEISVLRKADLQYILACYDSSDSKINTAIQGNFTLSYGVGGLTWTQYNGWTGDGIAYFTTGWNPTDESSNYSLNDAAMAVLTNNDEDLGNLRREVGVFDADSTAAIWVQASNVARQTGGMINSDNTGGFAGTVGDIFLVVNRTGDYEFLDVWVDGTRESNQGKFSAALPNKNLYIFAVNDGSNTGAGMSSNEIAYVWIGESLSDTQITNWDIVLDWFKLRMGF